MGYRTQNKKNPNTLLHFPKVNTLALDHMSRGITSLESRNYISYNNFYPLQVFPSLHSTEGVPLVQLFTPTVILPLTITNFAQL